MMKANAPIGLLAEASPELLVGLLGILKSGHGYVPLDPKGPADRLAFMIRDCGIEILVTVTEHLETAHRLIEENPSLKLICLDELDHVRCESNGAPNDPDGLAYLIYTSGSTGMPKGVPITHRNLSPLLHWCNDYFDLGEHSRVLQNLAPWFDFGAWELITTLLAGGTLYFTTAADVEYVSGYGEFIRKHSINTINTTPSFFRNILAGGGEFKTLSLVHLGGEALTMNDVNSILPVVGDECVVYNGYGPTEAVINCAIYRISPANLPPLSGSHTIPIGRESGNNSLYILDADLNPAPLGVPGELYIGGPLSHGYLNSPDLTAARFIPDPFGPTAGARLYRTGDIVRSLPDGEIEFLNRIDNQVKVRGFRIELGEIEATLEAYEGVTKALVVVREDEPGDKRVVAYMVCESHRAPRLSELRSFLKRRLPEYMVPAAFVVIDSIPLTVNGKVDHQALPAPITEELDQDSATPRNQTEELLWSIFCAVLNRERLSIHDNFFDLGGHSLLATQLVTRIRHSFKVEVPLRAIFESPTVASLSTRLELLREAAPAPLLTRIATYHERSAVPLSFAQERLWFVEQLAPGTAAYNMSVAVRLDGDLNVAALQESMREVLRRHDVLRVRIRTENGEAVQELSGHAVELVVEEVRGANAEERELEARIRAEEEAHRGFDITDGPLVRAKLLRLGDEDHVLLVTMHHIISDGWSMGIFARELTTLYSAFAQGAASPLPELPIQYQDFAVWQREWFTPDVLERHLEYWKRQLAGAPGLLDLPTDRPRPSVQTFRGATYSFILPAQLSQSLKIMSREENATIFMTLLAAYKILLFRYTGQTEIIVGTPIANRNRAEIEDLIGLFVNTLALRTSLSGSQTFRDLLGQVREVALDAYAHQDLPFEILVQELQPERSLSHNPLFQVTFSWGNASGETPEFGGLTLRPFRVASTRVKFDLELYMDERAGDISGTLVYNTDLFDERTIASLVGHFQTLLSGIAAGPEQSLTSLPLLTPEERGTILSEWNATASDYSQDSLAHQLFEAQAQRDPQALAVSCAGHKLTYGELNERANQLAHFLQNLGVGPETVVAVCLERSVEMVVAVLAVLKAGGAYLPLDPSYPVERLAYEVDDAGCNILLTQAAVFEKIPTPVPTVFKLDTDWHLLAGLSTANAVSSVSAKNLAYVIYTSGTTGTPKGVEIEHASLLNLIFWHQRAYAVSPADRSTQVASPAFDAAVWEIWPYLTAGASLHIIDEETRLTAGKLIDFIKEQGVTLSFLPTPLAEVVLKEDWKDVDSLRVLLTGGDHLHGRGSDLGFELVNHYGPTENTVVATSAVVPREADELPPIGRAIANTRVYILDEQQELAPCGVRGEIYIAGESLARGYRGRGDWTAERFIPDPYSENAGARMYRTGDIARWLHDGQIEYVGRADNQVKVRGYRIELGEIESVLSRHELVRECVVVAREDDGEKRLVGYVVPEREVSREALRAFSRERLPEYMVPAAFVMLDQLPLTANGKVDRKALPAPEQQRPELEHSFVAPRTETEELLARIWSEVLRLEQVGVNDNFFELGGDSILSIQIIARANQAGLQLSPRDLFINPAVAALAQVADTRTSSESTAMADQGVVTGSVPLTPIQQWFFEEQRPQPHHFNQSALLEVPAEVDAALLSEVLKKLVLQHDALRLRFTHDGSGWQQHHAESESAEFFSFHDLSSIPSSERATALEAEADRLQRSLNLTEGPLLRAALFRYSADEAQRLLLVIHHLVVDGVSWRILLEDLQRGYEQAAQGEEIELGAKTSSFKQWAERLSAYAQTAAVQEQRGYWNQAGSEGVARLPRDYEGGANTIASTRGVILKLDQEQTRALLQEVPSVYHTQINDVLLTALGRVLSEWSGSERVVVELEGHGREEIGGGVDVTRTVGWFTTLYPVVLEVQREVGIGEALKRVKEQLRAVPEKGIGYGLLRYMDQGELPELQAEVSFNYLGQFGQGLSAEKGWRAARESAGEVVSREGRRTHLLEVEARVAAGRLWVEWNYSAEVHAEETIRSLGERYMEVLEELIEHCRSDEAGGYTPSDFPLAQVTQEQLNNLFVEVDFEG